jgi:hypothetical protein
MTRFFLAGIEPDSERTEAAYTELRERSRIVVGCAARPRRIFKLDCRFEGRDCEIEVGRPLPDGGNVVVAILDHGREEAFVVHTLDRADPPTRVTRPVYTVTDFS